MGRQGERAGNDCRKGGRGREERNGDAAEGRGIDGEEERRGVEGEEDWGRTDEEGDRAHFERRVDDDGDVGGQDEDVERSRVVRRCASPAVSGVAKGGEEGRLVGRARATVLDDRAGEESDAEDERDERHTVMMLDEERKSGRASFIA